jgi:hypothetical protein
MYYGGIESARFIAQQNCDAGIRADGQVRTPIAVEIAADNPVGRPAERVVETAVANPPAPSPNRMPTRLLPKLVTATSSFPSPLKSR